ncbi:MAG: oligoendopeptidase F, partial [Paracoccaceae bacterium]|nr:oligoendopeptidase F [Paracoccaceae bacterium]
MRALDLPLPVFDADATAGGSLGDLPEWRLEDLYPGMDSPELRTDLDWLKSKIASFAEDYKGKLADLDAAGMLACIRRYEAISSKAGRVMSFAGLLFQQNMSDSARSKFYA